MSKYTILGLFVGFLVVVLIFVSMLQFGPEKEEPIEANLDNTRIYAVLAQAGLEGSIVDSTSEHTIVMIPIDKNDDQEKIAYYAAGAVSTAVPQTKEVIVQLYIDQKLAFELIAETSDIISYSKGEISDLQFEERIIRS